MVIGTFHLQVPISIFFGAATSLCLTLLLLVVSMGRPFDHPHAFVSADVSVMARSLPATIFSRWAVYLFAIMILLVLSQIYIHWPPLPPMILSIRSQGMFLDLFHIVAFRAGLSTSAYGPANALSHKAILQLLYANYRNMIGTAGVASVVWVVSTGMDKFSERCKSALPTAFCALFAP